QLWQLLGYVFALNSKAFTAATLLPYGGQLALWLVLLGGLSQGIGQSIILFINQVKPARFVLSLLINAILFTLGSLALMFSTWLITLLPWSVKLPLPDLLTVLGLAYAPLLFGFLGALPYLGLPILNLLSIWHLLATVVGFSTLAQVPVSRGIGYVVVGWVLLQVLQNTVGRPLTQLGKKLANRAAGVELVTNQRAIAETMRQDLNQVARDWQAELKQRLETLAPGPTSPASCPGGSAPLSAKLQPKPVSGRRKLLKTGLGVVALATLTALVLILLRPLREWWFGWFALLPGPLRWVFNLSWVALVGLVVAGLLAPLETLGWWAGWYDDDINTTLHAGKLAQGDPDQAHWRRYLVYLDGIGKSTFEYLPDIEEFLATLAPSLPEDVALIRGIMPYSVMNVPLDQNRPLAFLWRYADRLRFANPASLLGLLVNIRNVLIVGVSADKRYGPLYNQGIGQVIYDGLVKN
ncbi:MAG: CAAX protease, partial [Nodosilinea sp.]